MAATTPRRSSTAYLDGLRGLAATIVFVQHYIGDFTNFYHEFGFGQSGHYYFVSLPFIRVFWSGGNAAVVLFFLISGYVLTIGPLNRIRNGQPVGRSLLSAIVRRPIRLYLPPLIFSFVYALSLHLPGSLVMPLPGLEPQKDGLLAEVFWFAKISILYFNPFRTHSPSQFWYPYNMVMWTIPIELKGSMLVFAVTGLLAMLSVYESASHMRAVVAAISVFCCSATMLLMCWKWSMSCFLFGTFLAMVDTWSLDKQVLSKMSHRGKTGSLYTAFFVGWYLISQPAHKGDINYSSETPGWIWLTKMLPPGYKNDEIYFRFWQTWGGLLLVYALLRLSFPQRLLSSRPLLFLGDVSFMLYLDHLAILRMLGDRLLWDISLAIPDVGPMGLQSRFLVSFAIMLPVCLVAAKGLTVYLDIPVLKLSKKVAASLGLEGTTTSSKVDDTALLPVTATNDYSPRVRGQAAHG